MKVFLIFTFLFSNWAYANSNCDVTFNKLNACASVTWEQGPVVSSESIFNMDFYYIDTQAVAADITNVKVSLFMTAHGHGSSPVNLTQTAEGQFHVKRVYFTMPGVWDVKVSVLDTNGDLLDEGVLQLAL